MKTFVRTVGTTGVKELGFMLGEPRNTYSVMPHAREANDCGYSHSYKLITLKEANEITNTLEFDAAGCPSPFTRRFNRRCNHQGESLSPSHVFPTVATP